MWRRRRRPWPSSSIHSRRRGHSRRSASWATSTLPSDDGDEAAVGERGEHVRGLLVALEVELGQRRPAAHGRVALALADQAQHDRAHERLVARPGCGRRCPRPGGRRRRAHPGLAIDGRCERVVLPLLPELEQRGGEQRQRARLALHVIDKRVGELRLDAKPDPACGQLDCPAQLGGLHRPDEHVVCAEQLCQPREGGETAVEICSNRNRHDGAALRVGRRAGEHVDERGALSSRPCTR